MATLWRLSLRVCLPHFRCFELREELGLARPLRCSRSARLCWFLLGTLPRCVSAHGDAGEGAPGSSLCRRKSRWSDLADNGREGEPQAGPLGRVFLGLRLGLRAGVLLAKFFPLLLLYPLTYLAPGLSTLWFHLLLKATETSGPTYIKLGQWASTRHDLFSEAFCAQFSKLHVQVAPHPWAHTESLLQQAFGEDWGSLLSFDTQEPVGSGCVAQVYKAFASTTLLEKDRLWRLGGPSVPQLSSATQAVRMQRAPFAKECKPSENLADEAFLAKLLFPNPVRSEVGTSQVPGRPPKSDHLIPVAVKVLHPGLLTQVYMDLLLMKMGSHTLGLLPGVKWLSLPEIVEEFEKLMVQQTDLRYEARNLEHFQHNFENMASVKFPTPLHPLVSRDILVETYEESVPVSSYQQAGTPAHLKRKIAQLGINMLLKMIFVDNFVHGDLHPGNILVQGADGLSPSLETHQQQVNVSDTLVASTAPALCPLRLVLLDAGIVAELQASDLRNFRAVFLAVALGQLHVSSLLSSVFKLLMTHKVKLESNFASIVFAIMVLEGLGRSLDPKLDVLEAAKPFLLQGGGFL
ncbi:Adck2 [Phodopus roborovskii]|uniref:Adck2 protein n=1 Tax=Phodopus roborovskii TaxID=109678 RepID=A0AAV0AEJ4_PHORO|nr:Adck2 [Phodopus roborovskii]